MIKHFLFVAVIITIIFIGAACGNEGNDVNTQELPPTGTSVGGALMETGPEIDDDWELVSVQDRFQAGEEFYFSFNNNMPFDSEQVTIQLIDNSSEKVLAESDYEVNPDHNSITDIIWFGSPGRYTIAAEVRGVVRATREVIIE